MDVEMKDAQEEKTLINPPKLKVRIVEWQCVSGWRWIPPKDDQCGICRMPFDAACGTQLKSGKECTMPGDDCPLVVGTCSHCFHQHCIDKWLTAQSGHNLCPLCRGDWTAMT